jgi:pimeloyl-ACP methyl ester carboxylesterase
MRLAQGGELALYDFGGAGPLLLLHHASGFCARVFRRMATRLADRYRVVGFDARGHGQSWKPEAGYGWQVFADDLVEVARSARAWAGAERVSAVVGHSLGGIAGLLAALEEPELFERAVLFDPVVITDELAARFKLRQKGAPPAWLTTRLRQARFASREQALATFRGQQLYAGFDPNVLEDYVWGGLRETERGELELLCPPNVEASIYALGTTSGAFAMPGLRVPTLIGTAQGSRFAEAQAKVAGLSTSARIIELPGGHLMPLEQPDRAAELVLEFLS